MTEYKSYLQPEDEPVVRSFSDVDLSLTYSYAHYLNWLFDERVELIKGKVFEMSPAPNRVHQEVSATVFAALYNYLKGKPCKVYSAPFDVRFPSKSHHDRDIYTVLQPDICVVCDASKLDFRGCIGAPDIVVEILSPGNNKKELFNKYKVYEEFGVQEYWIIAPAEQTFLKYTLNEDGSYQPSRLMTTGDKITTEILPGFELCLDEVFAE